jgi:hypothetical protein
MCGVVRAMRIACSTPLHESSSVAMKLSMELRQLRVEELESCLPW